MVSSQLTEKGVSQYSTGLLKAYKHVKLILIITSFNTCSSYSNSDYRTISYLNYGVGQIQTSRTWLSVGCSGVAKETQLTMQITVALKIGLLYKLATLLSKVGIVPNSIRLTFFALQVPRDLGSQCYFFQWKDGIRTRDSQMEIRFCRPSNFDKYLNGLTCNSSVPCKCKCRLFL